MKLCQIVVAAAQSLSFSHICGRIIGYQVSSTDAFRSFSDLQFTRIEDPYVDGVVITRGTEKGHVWTFAASVIDTVSSSVSNCPCTNSESTLIPPFVGQDYFCESGATSFMGFDIFFSDDPLWDGEDCESGSTCCEFNDPPYFCKSVTEPTTDDIEVRICADQSLFDEDTPIELIEIFVQ